MQSPSGNLLTYLGARHPAKHGVQFIGIFLPQFVSIHNENIHAPQKLLKKKILLWDWIDPVGMENTAVVAKDPHEIVPIVVWGQIAREDLSGLFPAPCLVRQL